MVISNHTLIFPDNSRKGKSLPVLMMHGIACSSADFINIAPNVSSGYILWNAGYDVWIGNARGNSYSVKHVSINRKKNPKQFYDFR